MTTQTKHTPNWHADGTHIFAQDNPGGRKTAIAEVFRDAGAERALDHTKLIVQACNAHYQLVEACKLALRLSEAWLKDLLRAGEQEDGMAVQGERHNIKVFTAALALAEKGME